MSDEVQVVLREFIPSDEPCIYVTWRNSAYYGSGGARESAGMFFKKLTKHIKDTLSVASVRIACLSDDPHTIIGWSVSQGNHLEFVYVKVDFRNSGVGTLLVPKDIETVPESLTKIGQVIALKKKFKTKGEISANRRSQRAEEKGVKSN